MLNLRTYTVAAPSLPLHTVWQSELQPAPSYYWAGTATSQPCAASGSVVCLTAVGETRFADIQHQASTLWQHWQDLSNNPHPIVPRLLGGFSFWATASQQPHWRAFPAACFVLPQFMLSQNGDSCWLSVAWAGTQPPANLAAQLAAQAAQYLAYLQTTAQQPPSPLSPALTVPDCTASEWAARIRAATTQIQTGSYQKIVLSRTVTAYHQHRLPLATVLQQLALQYPQCFHFAFTPPAQERLPYTFFAASPELLLRVQGRQLHTMALAGSAARGKTPATDAEQARSLRHSPKDRREHQLVVDSILKRLQPLCTAIDCPNEPNLSVLPNIQHLLTPIRATLNADQMALHALAALHPTPAVGGSPREMALAALPELEPHQRGWYAAPVGWLAADGQAEFAVALRSAVTNKLQTTIYAGAGIVATSQPDSEWQETELKLKPLLNILNPS